MAKVGTILEEREISLINKYELEGYILPVPKKTNVRNKVNSDELYKIKRKLENLEGKLNLIEAKEHSSLEIEKDTLLEIKNNFLGQQKQLLEKQRELNFQDAKLQFSKIDLTFLGMSKPEKYLCKTRCMMGEFSKLDYEEFNFPIDIGLPVFAVYPVSSNKFGVEFDFLVHHYTYHYSTGAGKGDSRYSDYWRNYRTFVACAYSEVFMNSHLLDGSKLSKVIRDNLMQTINLPENQKIFGYAKNINHRVYRDTTSVSATFNSNFYGLIPDNVQEKIKESRPYFGDEIYIISEAQNYSIEEVKVEMIRDPLVVGVAYDESFLITEFNCTPIEVYAKDFFSGKKAGRN